MLKNFRSHPSILWHPNRRFYDGELETCGDPRQINAFLGSPLLPNPNFPLVFHAISGEDEREEGSPSYFNIYEAMEVVDYVKRLLKSEKHPVGVFRVILNNYHR